MRISFTWFKFEVPTTIFSLVLVNSSNMNNFFIFIFWIQDLEPNVHIAPNVQYYVSHLWIYYNQD